MFWAKVGRILGPGGETGAGYLDKMGASTYFCCLFVPWRRCWYLYVYIGFHTGLFLSGLIFKAPNKPARPIFYETMNAFD